MRRQAPPFEAIEAFLIASRADNFRRAAELLKISPSALSRRIQSLEGLLGRRLLVRDGRTPRLSAAGRRYIEEIEPAVEAIRRASDRVRGAVGEAPVRLIAPHSFAVEWLAPRLGGFRRARPDLEVELHIARPLDALARGAVDLAIALEGPDLSTYPTETLIEAVGVVAAAPELLALHGPLLALADLDRHRLLGAEQPRDLWTRWASAAGHAVRPVPAETFPTQALLYEAAAAGLGVAVGVSPLADRYFADGRLVPCLEAVALGVSYRLVWRDPAAREREDVAGLCAWLRAQARISRGDFLRMLGERRSLA